MYCASQTAWRRESARPEGHGSWLRPTVGPRRARCHRTGPPRSRHHEDVRRGAWCKGGHRKRWPSVRRCGPASGASASAAAHHPAPWCASRGTGRPARGRASPDLYPPPMPDPVPADRNDHDAGTAVAARVATSPERNCPCGSGSRRDSCEPACCAPPPRPARPAPRSCEGAASGTAAVGRSGSRRCCRRTPPAHPAVAGSCRARSRRRPR